MLASVVHILVRPRIAHLAGHEPQAATDARREIAPACANLDLGRFVEGWEHG